MVLAHGIRESIHPQQLIQQLRLPSAKVSLLLLPLLFVDAKMGLSNDTQNQLHSLAVAVGLLPLPKYLISFLLVF